MRMPLNVWDLARTWIGRACVGAACAAGLCQLAHAEQIIALSTSNTLLSFDSTTPGTVTSIGTVSGLVAGDELVGIDFRASVGPNNNKLYTIGFNASDGTARIYTLNANTAVATLIATLAADPADVTAPTPFMGLSGNRFGFDFNPVADRLRLVSDTGQNLRINVDTGLVQLDGPLAYLAGDLNEGDTPTVVAVAYTNSIAGASSTELFGVDIGQSPDLLVRIATPNSGTLESLNSLPFDGHDVASFEISGLTGTAYYVTTPDGSPSASSLFRNGPGGVVLLGTIGGGMPILGIATRSVVPEPSSIMLMGIGVLGLGACAARRARRPVPKT